MLDVECDACPVVVIVNQGLTATRPAEIISPSLAYFRQLRHSTSDMPEKLVCSTTYVVLLTKLNKRCFWKNIATRDKNEVDYHIELLLSKWRQHFVDTVFSRVQTM